MIDIRLLRNSPPRVHALTQNSVCCNQLRALPDLGVMLQRRSHEAAAAGRSGRTSRGVSAAARVPLRVDGPPPLVSQDAGVSTWGALGAVSGLASTPLFPCRSCLSNYLA